jgi:hypothetical protein
MSIRSPAANERSELGSRAGSTIFVLMWSSTTSAMSPFSSPRASAISCRTSAQPISCSIARSRASIWPRMRRIRPSNLEFSGIRIVEDMLHSTSYWRLRFFRAVPCQLPRSQFVEDAASPDLNLPISMPSAALSHECRPASYRRRRTVIVFGMAGVASFGGQPSAPSSDRRTTRKGLCIGRHGRKRFLAVATKSNIAAALCVLRARARMLTTPASPEHVTLIHYRPRVHPLQVPGVTNTDILSH